jgi:hypothetical protein
MVALVELVWCVDLVAVLDLNLSLVSLKVFMIDGIYLVSFSSSVEKSDQGIVVIKKGSINGGDPVYLYIGEITETDGIISGILNIRRWNEAKTSVSSVFNSFGDFTLKINGNDTSEKSFYVSGSDLTQPNLTIQITGRFLSEAS